MQRVRPSNRIITRRRLTSLAVIGLSAALVLVLMNLLFAGNSSLLGLILILALVAIPACVVMVVKWRWGLFIVAFILIFEGVARNLTNQVAFLLIKDAILGLIYLGYIREKGLGFLKNRTLLRFFIFFMVVTVYLTVEILNPSMPSVLVGLIGLKTYILYIPMLFLAYEVLDTPRKLEQFILFVLALGLGSSALGAFQFYGGIEVVKIFQPGDVISTFGSGGDFVSYKLPGSFGGPGNFSYFLQLIFALAIGLLYSKTSRWISVFCVISLSTSCFLLILNSQRVAWIFIILCFFAGTFTYSSRWWLRFLRFALAALLMVSFVYAISSPDNVIGSRFNEFTQGEGVNNYLYAGPTDQIGAQLEAIAGGKFFGLGTGMGAPGARYLLDSDFTFVESFLAILLYELGPVGFFLMMGLILLAVSDTWQVYLHAKGSDHRNLVFFSFLWLVYMTITGLTYAPITIPPVAQFFWILPGMALRLKTWSAPAGKTLKPDVRPATDQGQAQDRSQDQGQGRSQNRSQDRQPSLVSSTLENDF